MRLGKFPKATGDVRADSMRELRWAMSGEGLTPDKLPLMQSTLSLPAVRAALRDVPESESPIRAYDVICDSARSLGGGLPAQALRSALAIDYAGGARNLSDRRAELADHRDPHTLYYIEQRMLGALVTALGGVSAGADRVEIEPPTEVVAETVDRVAAPRVWGVPLLRDPNFVGRADLLNTLRAELLRERATALTHTVTQAVSGLGGIGKTSLAAEYAYRFAAEYDVIWWVRSEDPTTLASDYVALHRVLTGEECEDQQLAVNLVREWLSAHDGWLLVFDNAEEMDDVSAYIPGLRGHVIVTSRNADWSRLGAVVDVPPLDSRSATELVIRRTGSDDEEAAAILGERLGGVPKVIEVASSLFTRGLSTDLREFVGQLGDGARATEGVWDAALDRALAVPGAIDVLAACVVLNPDSLALPLVEVASGRTADAIERAATPLRAHQILQRSAGDMRIHRLVVAAAKERLGDERVQSAAQRAATFLLAMDPQQTDDLAAFRRLQTHAPYVAGSLGDAGEASRLLTWYSRCLRRDGDYVAAIAAAERAITAARSAGVNESDCLGVLAVALRDSGRLADAEGMITRAIDACPTGTADAMRAQHLHVLATIRCDRGDLAGARTAAQTAVAIVERLYGGSDARLARPLEVLAWIQRELGALPAAEAAARRALTISERLCAPTDLELAWRLDALAVILREQGQPAEARGLIERAMAITKETLGPTHRAIGSQSGVLSRVLRELGDASGALAYARQAVDISTSAHGPEHPVVAVQLGNLALAQADVGDLDGALASIEWALRASRATLGNDHRDVGWQLAVLSRILRARGELDAAHDAAVEALHIGESTLTADHSALAARRRLVAEIEAELASLAPASGRNRMLPPGA
jgi:tetratricopeptide (TPR) repeat protein